MATSDPTPLKPLETRAPAARARRLLEILCALLLFALMALTAVDVVGRYVLNSPVRGSFQYVELLMAVLVAAGMPLVTARDEHLRAGMLDHLFSERFNRLCQPVIDLFSLLAMGVLAWRLFVETQSKLDSGETLAVVNVPVWIPVAVFCAAAAASALLIAALGALRLGGRR